MILSRGRLVFQQYIKNQRDKCDLKFFGLRTDDGLVLNVEIYSSTKFECPESLGQTSAVVFHPMQSYLDKGYHLLKDN